MLANFPRGDFLRNPTTISKFSKRKGKSSSCVNVLRKRDIREIKIHVYAKQQTLICTTWPSFPLIFRLLYCFYTKISSFFASFIHRNRSGLVLSAYFLYWEILNLSLTSAVCRLVCVKRESFKISLLWRVVQYTRTVTVRISHVSIRTDRTDRQQGYTVCKECFMARVVIYGLSIRTDRQKVNEP